MPYNLCLHTEGARIIIIMSAQLILDIVQYVDDVCIVASVLIGLAGNIGLHDPPNQASYKVVQ